MTAHPTPMIVISPAEFAAQLDAAKERAQLLRRQAIHDGWHALEQALLHAWHAARHWRPRHRAATMRA
jgi:hypothetical protein